MRLTAMLTLPTRDLTLVLDPVCLEDLLRYPLAGAVVLVGDLMGLNPPININLVFPEYLATEAQRDLAESGRVPLTPFYNEGEVPALTLSRDIRRRLREPIERGAEGDCRGLRLLALAAHFKADGVVTAIPSLLEARHRLLQHHKFRIVPPEQLPDLVEVCARGHGVSCSATLAPRWLPPDILYQATHWKGRRLSEWFGNMSGTLSDKILREHLRSAFLNRYPFILHARDMVRFFELQKDHYFRRGRHPQVFRAPLNYHLTAFYVHVWGMLDTLASIANRHLSLGVDPLRCGITRDRFLRALSEKRPALLRFIKKYSAQWISIIGDVRHPVAHSALRLQQDIVTATEESKKTDDEISEILRQEDPETYKVLPSKVIKAMEPVLIQTWRMNKMKVVTDDAIYVEQVEGGYFRPPVASIDFDLEMLNAFVDAFLFACFGRQP